jgi:hypothetical protein
MNSKPRRVEGIELERMADGFMLHQADRERVHYLNHTAAIVLELCDGERDEDAIARELQNLYELTEVPHAEVAACLASLLEELIITKSA